MKRFILGTILIFVLIILPSSLAIVAYAYRDQAPEELKEKAWAAIEQARAVEARKYARAVLDQSERAFRTGQTVSQQEAAKVYFLRDFDVSRSLFLEAANHAEKAAALAVEQRESAIHQAEAEVNKARQMIDRIARLKDSFQIDSLRALKWSRAKLALQEAEIYYRSHEYEAAAKRASEASRHLDRLWKSTAQIARRFIDWNELQKWKKWIHDTIEFSRKQRTSAIVVDKLDHTLILYKNGRWIKSFQADLGSNSIHRKYIEGDNATPEGKYKIIQKRGKGKTKYYKALLLDYPNEEDKKTFREAMKKGMISKRARIGGMIEIHGDGGREQDWTEGCVALANKDMDELFNQVSIRTPVTIVGSRYYDQEFANLIRRD